MKQAQEIIFVRKTQKQNHPNKLFNQSTVIQVNSQKHVGIFFDKQIYFKEHLPNIYNKAK